MNYPIVAKPDIGERGYKVLIINDAQALQAYLNQANKPILIQEYIDYSIELSVLAYYLPDGSEQTITSICYKEPLFVTGDGLNTIRELIKSKDRAFLQIDRLEIILNDTLNLTPKRGERVILDLRGNHSKGATFLNYNHKINRTLVKYFANKLKLMGNTYYGRFDVKCNSWNDFEKAKNIKLIEFNGVGGEPAHVYDPSLSYIHMVKVMYQHWNIIYTISRQQIARGYKVPALWQGIKDLIKYRNNL